MQQYVEDIASGRIPACKWVKLAVARHMRDLDDATQGRRSDIYFDDNAAQHAIDFYQFLKHSKGEWAGQVFVLEPWQQFVIWVLFGWKRQDGTRRFRTAYLEVARKNGKTTLLAGIGLYLFYPDGEPGAEIYTAATKRDQARISHGEATRMVKSSPALRRRIGVFKDNLHIIDTACKFEPLGADADSMDGLNVHGALIDELHAHKDRRVWDVLETATGSRRQPLQMAITTAGFDRHSICWEQHQYVERILERVIDDDTYFGIIYTLDEGDDWEDERNWIKANPNLGVSVKYDDLKRKAEKAKQVPSALNAFLRLHMDIWTESVTRWIPLEAWRACGGHVDADGLKGRICYGGLDLSSSIDITAWVKVFPPAQDGDKYQVICKFYIPQDNIEGRVRRDRVPYDVWVRQGFVTATPGNVIDYNWILNDIRQDYETYDLRDIGFDRWGSAKIAQDIQEIGGEKFMVQIGQGWASMSAPTKELEKMILAGEIAHGDNPVLTWMISNVVVRQDPAGNLKPDKEKSSEKIDGVVALIMAIDRATRNKTESVYDERGIITIE